MTNGIILPINLFFSACWPSLSFGQQVSFEDLTAVESLPAAATIGNVSHVLERDFGPRHFSTSTFCALRPGAESIVFASSSITIFLLPKKQTLRASVSAQQSRLD
jgi:hypothetical protein